MHDRFVTSPEPLWEVRNGFDMRTVCFVTRIDDTFVLLVKRGDQFLVCEQHVGPCSAIDRADAIYRDLVDHGWMLAAEHGDADYSRREPRLD
jgi:hypothetical protein